VAKGPSGDGIKFRAVEQRWSKAARQREAQKAWARRELEKLRAERDADAKVVPITKAKKFKGGSKPKTKSKAARVMDLERCEVDQVVSRSAQQHGDYQVRDHKLQEVTEGGKRVEKTIRVIRNLGGTPVERWHHRGYLDERQMAAILFYQLAWRTWIGQPRVVANWSAVIVRDADGAAEIYAGSRIAAKESLRLLDQEVFFRMPVGHFQVWQNVVVWDEPAGIAGSRAGFLHKQAEGAARAIVSIIASMIADIVIDSSRRDFGDLLLDLDAPRRPGGKSA
jgi:hypothetical protein